MWKYVSRRVKDTIELGIHVRKSFTVQPSLNGINQQHQQQHNRERKQNLHHLDHKLVSFYQDPSRDKDKSDEKFKRKYNRLHDKNKCYLSALKWSTAIITGFYTAQLLCLYKRQKPFFDRHQCYYSKYLVTTSQSIHQNVRYLLTQKGQQTLIPAIPKLEHFFFKRNLCKQKNSKKNQKQTFEDELAEFKHFVDSGKDPGYNKYSNFFENTAGNDLYNVSKDTTEKPNEQKENIQKQADVEAKDKTPPLKEDAVIDEAIRHLAHIVGELEFQLGIESFLAGDHKDAVVHFKLSTHHNHPGGVFNLALCFERGLGIKRNLKAAKKLYEIASELGSSKAFYNLGVYYAQGLGGAEKNAQKAKEMFAKAAELGSTDAVEALSLLIPQPKKLPVIEEFQEDEYDLKSIMPSAVSAIANFGGMRQVAVT